jgi:hypothetical protein
MSMIQAAISTAQRGLLFITLLLEGRLGFMRALRATKKHNDPRRLAGGERNGSETQTRMWGTRPWRHPL